MKHYATTILLLLAWAAQAQQWLDKKYEYDSLLNVTYGAAVNFNGSTDSLHMDIYLPSCDNAEHISRRPVLMWVHGGAFLAGDKNDPSITNLCKQFAKRGYVTASIDYRLGFVSDDNAWNCNYPNYSCVFASDSAEWYRAYYRAIQDAKGALRYLINRHDEFRIDTANIFVAGESAGAFIALGVGLMNDPQERPLQTFALSDAQMPSSNTNSCLYNVGEIFSGNVVRPDLDGIEGTIEPTDVNFTITGIGNMYGGMLMNLLAAHPANKPKPAIYSFHQPCDIVVPIDSANVYWGLSWCMTNGYNCYGITNTAKVYGSRTFSNWNSANGYGYNIHDEFTATDFPYSFLFGTGSCFDQVNNPCHAYDSPTLRENNLAAFFGPLITTNPVCDTTFFPVMTIEATTTPVRIFPNPAQTELQVSCPEGSLLQVLDMTGRRLASPLVVSGNTTAVALQDIHSGMYLLQVRLPDGSTRVLKFVKS